MSMHPDRLNATVSELATRPGHEKVRFGVATLLIDALGADPTDVRFEQPLPEVRGRADALLGRTVFEFKTDLRIEREDAERQLARYLRQRETETDQRYLGIATDGSVFAAYELGGSGLQRIGAAHRTDASQPSSLLAWLNATIALTPQLKPDAEEMRRQLGRESIAFNAAFPRLKSAWHDVADLPPVQLKRQLWARLLSRVYGSSVDEDALFLQHTYLTIVAKAVAIQALGLAIPRPHDLLSGKPLRDHDVYGAVESDFLDWILEASRGPRLVTEIAEQVARFRLDEVKEDVLKALYESLIDPAQRHDLGEFYTPDWLAAWMCEAAIADPLGERVLDPACGSGSFLFHAVRRRLAAAQAAGHSNWQALPECLNNVLGVDVHPVAVIIARVTYLLAITEERLRDRPPVSIPVYLGDSLQWHTREFFGRSSVEIQVPNDDPLTFPTEAAEDPGAFDRVIEAMLSYSAGQYESEAFRTWAKRNTNLADEHVEHLTQTYAQLRRLTEDGRNHIWGYVARNMARPIWLSQEQERPAVLIGNPPWLPARDMAPDQHKQFDDEARTLAVATGKPAARDLSAYFFARCVELYLRSGARIAFVMPLSALGRSQFKGLRKGEFAKKGSARYASVCFEEVWDLQGVEPLFKVPACVLFAKRAPARTLPDTKLAFTGKLPRRDAEYLAAKQSLNTTWVPANVEVGSYRSPYGLLFRQGCPLGPRVLFFVREVQAPSRLGTSDLAPIVESVRSNQEDERYKDAPSLHDKVEHQFIRPFLLSGDVASFRLLSSTTAIVPVAADGTVMGSSTAAARGYLHLSNWMKQAEQVWKEYADKDRDELVEAIDFHGSLRSQIGISGTRVIYNASGTYPKAAIVDDDHVLVSHKLYWMPVDDPEEAWFLLGIFNTKALMDAIDHLIVPSGFGKRDISKDPWRLAIPRFDPSRGRHVEITQLAREAAKVAEEVRVQGLGSQTAQRRIRDAVWGSTPGEALDDAVRTFLGV